MSNPNPFALTTSLTSQKLLVCDDGTVVPVLPQAISGLATEVTLAGPDVTGSGPASDVPTNLSLVVSTVAGNASKALGRARFNDVFVEGPNATIELPIAPLTGDMVAISFQFSGEVGAPATTLNNQGSDIPLEIPTAPATYAASVSVIDSTAKLIYMFDGTGEHQWSLLSSNLQLANFAGPLSPPANGGWSLNAPFFDPQNATGAASDSGPGTAAAPLLTWKEYVRRLGSLRPNFAATALAVTATWLSPSSSPTADVVTLDMFTGSSLTIASILGTQFGVTNPAVFTGALAGVTAISRGTGGSWSISSYAGIAVGQKIVNTTRENSVAFVMIISEGVATISAPMNPSTATAAGTPNNAWANGDGIEAFTEYTIAVGEVRCSLTTVQDPPAPPFGLVFQNCTPTGPGFYAGGTEVTFVECYVPNVTIDLTRPVLEGASNNSVFEILNVETAFPTVIAQDVAMNSGTFSMVGGGVIISCNIGNFTPSQDVLFCGIRNFIANMNATLANALGLAADAFLAFAGEAFVGGTFYGPPSAGIDVVGSGLLAFNPNTTAVATFLGGFDILLNGSANGISKTNAAGVYTLNGPITITPAHLDAAAGAAGFGGFAYSTDGNACIAALLPNGG
jgi:hypothetical protein